MISFIIPVRNEEKALPRTLANIREYSGPHEAIVTDDQSSDGTVAVAKLDSDLVIENTARVRMTIGANRNIAAARAKGELFVFADADSYVMNPNDFFPKVEAMFRDDPRLGALTFFNRFTPGIETWRDRFFLAYFNNVAWLINLIGFGTCTGKMQVMRAETFRSLGGYNPALAASEDVELFRRMAKIGKTRSARSLTVYHSGRRQHAIGWGRLIWIWTVNSAAALFFKKSYSKEWKEVR
jgi:glycosyltransferase involved in cell wall biosynthesis